MPGQAKALPLLDYCTSSCRASDKIRHVMMAFKVSVSDIENNVAVVGKAKIRVRGSMPEVVERDWVNAPWKCDHGHPVGMV